MNKKIILYLLFGCLVTGMLSGCGSIPKEEQPDEKEEHIVLRFFHYQGEAEDAYNKVFEAYEKEHPNVKIVSEFLNSDSYIATLDARIATKDCLDIIGVHPGLAHVIPLAEAGYLADLTGQPCLSGIIESCMNTASFGNGIYGVPTDQSYICTFYNKDIFDEYHLTKPETWDEFLEVCQVLKAEGITPIALSGKDTWIQKLIPYALAPTTIYRYNNDFDDAMYDGQRCFNGEEWNNTLIKLQEIINNGYVTENFLKVSYDQQLSAFANGQAAMMIMGTWGVSLVQNMNENCNFGLFVVPVSDDRVNWMASSVGGMLSVYEDSEHKEEAIDFLNFFLQNDEVYGQFLEDTGNISIRTDFSIAGDLELQSLTENIPGSYTFLDVNWPNGFGDEFVKMIETVSRGKDISDALESLDAVWKRMVSKE